MYNKYINLTIEEKEKEEIDAGKVIYLNRDLFFIIILFFILSLFFFIKSKLYIYFYSSYESIYNSVIKNGSKSKFYNFYYITTERLIR